MKKLGIILLICISNFASYIQAQTGGFHIGIKAGLNRSNVYDKSGEEFVADAKYGYAFGGFVSIPIGEFIGVQPEVLYSQKGFKANGRLLGSTYSFTRTSSFIDVPLHLQLKFGTMFSFLVGPQFSFLTQTKDEYNDGSISIDQQKEITNDNIKKNILGASLGFDIYVTQLVISGRVAWDLQKNNGDGTSDKPRYRNVVAQLTLGLMF